MRLTKMFLPTRKEDPADAEVISHKLLLRAGYIRQVARGIYSFLPLGWRSVRKIETIVRQEMDRAGAQEIHMPSVQPAELWEESGRWEQYGVELLRMKDRKGGRFALGPTHEEVVTDIIRNDVHSYKQLPLNVYQIQTKFRDEARPRFGLMRCREFIMKDAYSFDIDEASAHHSYEVMFEAYRRIFTRFGFNYRAVEADTGNIGGDLSHEFQALAETGEDKIVSCTNCDYAANVEKAEAKATVYDDVAVEQEEMTTVATPGARTIAEVSEHLGIEASEIVKTLIYMVEAQPVVVLVRGDHDVNEIKLKALLESHFEVELAEVELAPDQVVEGLTRAPVGFAGPVYLKDVTIFADETVRHMANFVVGANRKNKHLTNVNVGRDFEVNAFADLREVTAGDVCARCGEGTFEVHRGIEVGHIFHLGTKYSDALSARLQNEALELLPLQMGCYGIGITRILAAAIEQNHDDNGMILPMSIAPYHVIILPLQMKDEAVVSAAEDLYQALKAKSVEVLLDDRDLRPGAKFKDADLIGVPLRISIGARGLKDGMVEFKPRTSDKHELLPVSDIVEHVCSTIYKTLDG